MTKDVFRTKICNDFYTAHVYDKLDSLVQPESGRKSVHEKVSDKQQWECEQICDRTFGCESIGICGSTCHFYDQIVTNNVETQSSSGCYTAFRTCDKGNY